MALLDFLKTKMGKKAITPTITDSTNSALIPQDDNTNSFLSGHENFYTYSQLPNILGPMNTTVDYDNPQSVHAPFIVERNKEYYVSGAGKHYFDGADPSIERIPRSELQVQFDTKKEVPSFSTGLIPASGVEVPSRSYNYGSWHQAFVAWSGMYSPSILNAPPLLLSHPIHVTTGIVQDAHRQSLKTRAPKQKRNVT
jgi:hypothetical protein